MININKKRAIQEILKAAVVSREELMVIKRRLAKEYGISVLSNSEILKAANDRQKKIFQQVLRKRAVRTLSGIAPVAVLTKPFPCPGKCAYCPSEKDVPQSYLSNEPAVMRAIRLNYNPYDQVQQRLKALEANGHNPNKIEIIVIGGTWSVLPEDYKYWCITEVFRAANEYKKAGVKKKHKPGAKIEKLRKALLLEQRKNEKTKYKIIGLTLETRPDYIDEKELLEMRELGCTRVELGVQAIDDKILKLNRRGHTVARIAEATALLRDFGFKITYHLMPALPGATPAKDLKIFKQLFSDKRFQPDQIKFYPTVVTKGSLLYKWWKQGKYKPYSDLVLQKLIADCKNVVPPYVRIIRLIRDIPAESIIAGNIITNLRQVMQQRGIKCSCIRCREAKEEKFSIANFQLSIIKYDAAGGREYFIEAVSKDGKTLYGFCRLRLPLYNKDKPLKVLQNSAIIRELHVYGELVPVGSAKKIQHTGLGKLLMKEAQKIAFQNGHQKMAIISGVGARGYYRKLGYSLKETYMVKKI